MPPTLLGGFWSFCLWSKQRVLFFDSFISQEHLRAPIYWSPAPIYWSPKILFSTFWKGMKRKSYDKTRFCVSHEGLSNGLGTFGLTWYMFENKTKNMFLIWRGSNVLEPRLQYNGARAPIYWSPSIFFPIRHKCLNLFCYHTNEVQ